MSGFTFACRRRCIPAKVNSTCYLLIEELESMFRNVELDSPDTCETWLRRAVPSDIQSNPFRSSPH